MFRELDLLATDMMLDLSKKVSGIRPCLEKCRIGTQGCFKAMKVSLEENKENIPPLKDCVSKKLKKDKFVIIESKIEAKNSVKKENDAGESSRSTKESTLCKE